jgi:hypothetical protein
MIKLSAPPVALTCGGMDRAPAAGPPVPPGSGFDVDVDATLVYAHGHIGGRYLTSLPPVETSRMSPAISTGIGGMGSLSTEPGPDHTRLTCSAGSRSG